MSVWSVLRRIIYYGARVVSPIVKILGVKPKTVVGKGAEILPVLDENLPSATPPDAK